MTYSVLMAQVASEGQQVKELESYLGGEIPNIKGKKGSEAITWKEERELLYCEIQVCTSAPTSFEFPKGWRNVVFSY